MQVIVETSTAKFRLSTSKGMHTQAPQKQTYFDSCEEAIQITQYSNSPGAPGGLGKTGGLIPGSNGAVPGIFGMPGVGCIGRRGL